MIKMEISMRAFFASIIVLLSMSAAAFVCPDYNQYGETYTLTGQQLYAPQDYPVTAGGGNSLTDCGFSNTGYVITAPDFSFNLSGTGAYDRLEIEVTAADCDTVLLVNSADATWFFDDDTNGNLPVVNLYGTSNTEGWVDVWVGTYGSSTCAATLQMETW